MQIMSRVVFELSFQVQAVLHPRLALIDLKTRGHTVKDTAIASSFQGIRDRLCAYTAWCLRADLETAEKFTKPSVMRQVFDPRPIQELARNPERLRAQEVLFGPVEVLSMQEADKDRQEALATWEKRKARLRSLLSDSRLTQWLRRIQALRERQIPVSLFNLIGEDPESLRSFLEKLDLGVAHLLYTRDSQAVHGSSLVSSLVLADNVVSPQWFADSELLDNNCDSIATNCKQIAIFLWEIRDHLAT